MRMKARYRLAIFASGGGSNASCIINYFKSHNRIEIVLVVSNNSSAGVLTMAKSNHISTKVITRSALNDQDSTLSLLATHDVDFIILAGFLLLMPPYLVAKYTSKIINIHPSLLPKYGGKGMYGHFVHEAVKNAGDKESGCTIHLVNEHFDEGEILKQVSCEILPSDTPTQIGESVLKLEHAHYAPTIEEYIMSW